MRICEHNIEVTKTAQYYTNEAAPENCKYLWIMCHGYGMLAENILQKMDWTDEDHFLISVEGLSKFYWDGLRGRPAASWMTKKNRLTEIEDYSNLLSKVYEKYQSLISKETKIILFGFSQGGTTIWRWLHNKQIHFDAFLNYAGWVPEDISFDPEYIKSINQKALHMVYGDKDPYLTDAREEQLQEVAAKHGLQLKYKMFQGEHKIYPQVVQEKFEEFKIELSRG